MSALPTDGPTQSAGDGPHCLPLYAHPGQVCPALLSQVSNVPCVGSRGHPPNILHFLLRGPHDCQEKELQGWGDFRAGRDTWLLMLPQFGFFFFLACLVSPPVEWV